VSGFWGILHKVLSEIMEIAKSKQANMILTRDISRISRDTFHSLKFIENIRKYVEFKTIDIFDTSQDEWDSMLSVLSNFFDTHKMCTFSRFVLSPHFA
jgi:DNA invertase Pin-like site-specific DNA recombinase